MKFIWENVNIKEIFLAIYLTPKCPHRRKCVCLCVFQRNVAYSFGASDDVLSSIVSLEVGPYISESQEET